VDLRTLTSKFGPAADASAGVQTTIAKEIIEAADNIVLSAHLAADEPYTLQSYTDDLYDLFFATPAKAGELTQTDKTLQRALIHAMLDVVGGKAKAEVAMLEEAPTSFALSSDGGYLRHVYVGHIDEQKAYFLLLADKIHTLAAKMKKQSHTDTAHWLLLEKVTAGAVAE
jgi:hypothetical protein